MREGAVKPLILRTNCSDAARISSSVAGGSKLNRVLMFRHMTSKGVCWRFPIVKAGASVVQVFFGTVVGIVAGCASALFLFLLDPVTGFRVGHETIVYTLPLAGLALGWFHERFGQ